MHHKLQSSSLKNHGKQSVVREQQAKPNRQKSRERGTGDRSGKHRSRQDGRVDSKRSSASSSRDALRREPEPERARSREQNSGRGPGFAGGGSGVLRKRPSPSRESRSVVRARTGLNEATALRCEVPHSTGFDPTGERAFPCGARADVICETCGPMCSTCAEETFCQHGAHKLAPLPESEPEPVREQPTRPV